MSKTETITFASTFHRIASVGYASRYRFINTNYIAQKHTIFQELLRVWEILQATHNEKFVLLSSTSGKVHPDLLAAILMRLRPANKRPVIVVLGCMWEQSSGILGWAERLFVRLLDPIVMRYLVQSSEELLLFPNTWGIDPSKTRLCLHFCSINENDLISPPPPEDYIFAGGNSKRNYEPLLKVARIMPEQRFIIATNQLDRHTNLPPNVQAASVSHQEFMHLMLKAKIVVTPLVEGLARAAGQQTYLNAMLMGKPVIVNQVNGVRDHICHNVDGMIVDGTTEGYYEAIQWMLDINNKAKLDLMIESAKQRVIHEFTKKHHVERLLDIMQELIDEVSTMPSLK